MSERPLTLMDRYRQLPRALQWAAVAAIAMILFMAWTQYLEPVVAMINDKGDDIQRQVNEIRTGEDVTRNLRSMRDVVTTLGPVQPPPSEAEGSKMFNDVVLEVLQKHGTTPNLSSRSRGKLPKTALTSLTRGKRIDRLTGDLKFDATPQVAAAIIADLESSPHIESINSVRMVKDTGGKVKVHLTIEAWLLSSDVATGATSL